MLRILSILTLLLALAAPARAQQAPDPDVENVIRQQLDAFQADDLATAFTFASPGIRRTFRTPEAFGTMVRRGYPMVWRPAEVTFLELMQMDRQVAQKVLIRDRAGALHVLIFVLVATGDDWQIAAVRILETPERAA
ncbi:DUF4864 domain-containing protein [Roseitranquillus sediminis]|uniref:DUF4864 domain-containing protein n=1 Tax=Roseitranquillus sediminis TaxID=2809051 RepID=UPI001D0BFC6F|nr:DUF4864 domain-containing protein [Roseitranquillus sediminis]MBM9595286.1 DUF4864 domain-containing protein [Roseitranquillus sediminis]